MAATSAQITALEEAYYSGVLTVSHNGKTVTYASLDDLWAAIQRAKASVKSARRRIRAGVIGYKPF